MDRYKIEIIQDGQQEPLLSAEFNFETLEEAVDQSQLMMKEAKPIGSKPYHFSIAKWLTHEDRWGYLSITMKKKEKQVITGTWEDVIKASVKDNPKPKPKKKPANKEKE